MNKIFWQSCSISSEGRTLGEKLSGVIQIESVRAQEIIGVHLIMTAKYNFPFVFNLISILK